MRENRENLYDISVIRAAVAGLRGGDVSAPTFRKLKAAAGIPSHVRVATFAQSVRLVAASLLRLEQPSVKLTRVGVSVYATKNSERLALLVLQSGAVKLPPMNPVEIPDCFWEVAVDYIAGSTGQRPSLKTLYRWCQTLSIQFSEKTPIPSADVMRLIEHSRMLKERKRANGRMLGSRNRAA